MKQRIINALHRAFQFLSPVRVALLAAICAFFFFLVLGDKGIYHMRRLLDMKKRLTQERQTLNDDIDRLTSERRILTDPTKLEMVIRSELGYIRPGEILFEEKKAATAAQ